MEVPIGVHARPTATKAVATNDTARFSTIVDLLLTVAYVDGEAHPRELAYIQKYVASLLLVIEQSLDRKGVAKDPDRDTFRAHFEELHRELDAELVVLAAEADPHGTKPTKLIARATTLFGGLSSNDQAIALELIHGLIHADGLLAPRETELYRSLAAAHAPPAAPAPAPAQSPTLVPGTSPASRMLISTPVWKELGALAHPLLDPLEQTLSPHPVERQAQVAWDYHLVQQAINLWNRHRSTGTGRLTGVTDIDQLPAGASFLDGYVHVARPDVPVELIVLGDLHGCYSCLKAALLQSNFIERAWAHQWDPKNHPDVKLVLLGDYIDRGLFSFDGVMRAALQLFVSMPDQVILLRGNHEWLKWHDNRIVSGVYPAEALASIAPHVPIEMLEGYRLLFEHMPTSFLCDRTMFVHGGIPREDTLANTYQDLASLNELEIRFQMMWSDPGQLDHVPVEQQHLNPRFTFGRNQFRTFMERVGMHTMVRGHEVIDRGFDVIYNLGEHLLLTVFSAGGHENCDLPVDSSYRSVTPMALTIQMGDGAPTAVPWPIQYQPFNYEPHNGLYRAQPVLEFRYT